MGQGERDRQSILIPIMALRRRRYLQRKRQREEVVHRLQEALITPPVLTIKEFEGIFSRSFT